MNNGKQSEQLLKVLGGHFASLDRTSKCRGLSEQPLYSGGHKAMQHETRNWNNFDKCEPEQQYRLGTVSYKITGGLKPVLQVPNLTLSFCNRLSKLPDDGDPWAPNNLLTPEQKKNTSWTPVGQATDKKLRPQPTKMNSFKSGPS